MDQTDEQARDDRTRRRRRLIWMGAAFLALGLGAVTVWQARAGCGAGPVGAPDDMQGERAPGRGVDAAPLTALEPRLPADDAPPLPAGEIALSGTVHDVGGGVVADAHVAVRLAHVSTLDGHRAPTTVVRTDERGRYALQVPAVRLRLRAWHRDYAVEEVALEVATDPVERDFHLVPAGIISGVVREMTTGAPVPDATVEVRDGHGAMVGSGLELLGGDVPHARTDAQGRFRIGGVPPGLVEVRAWAREYAPTQPVMRAVGIADEVSGVVVTVVPAFSISGRVLVGARPAAGVTVRARSTDRRPGSTRQSAATDATGSFTIPGLPAGRYTLGTSSAEYPPTRMDTPVLIIDDRSLTDVEVRVPAGQVVVGQIEPPGAASIDLDWDDDQETPPPLRDFGLGRDTHAQADGRFEVRGLAPGRYHLTALGHDGSHARVPVEVRPGEHTTVRVAMTPRPGIAGRVLEVGGREAASAALWVRARPDPYGVAMESQASPDGSFALRGLEPGAYRLEVGRDERQLPWAEDMATPVVVTVEAGPGITDLELRVRSPGGVLAGVVLGPDGAPASDVWVGLRTTRRVFPAEHYPEGDLRRALQPPPPPAYGEGNGDPDDHDSVALLSEVPVVLTDERGRFRLEGLETGHYQVLAESASGDMRGRSAGVDVQEGTAGQEVTLTLRQHAALTGVVRHGRDPVTDYDLTLQGPGFREEARNIIRRHERVWHGQGRYHLAYLPLGRYRVSVTSAAGSAAGVVSVNRGGMTTLDLDITPWSRVRGTLVDIRTGEPIVGVAILVMTERPSHAQKNTRTDPVTDARGRFDIPGLSPGTATITCLDRATQSTVCDLLVEVVEGRDLDLGTIQGVTPRSVAEARGTLGLELTRQDPRAFLRMTELMERHGGPMAMKDDEVVAEMMAEMMDEMARGQREGLWVSQVQAEGPAHAAGIRPGDEVVAIDGVRIRALQGDGTSPSGTPSDRWRYQRMVADENLRAGQVVHLELERSGGERLSVAVTAAATSGRALSLEEELEADP